jgi:TPP-dependent pyruvate/acetoin dehydrogenase alpha subunit
MSDISRDKKIGLYKGIQWVRLCEETLAKLYKEQEMRTPTHFGVGQEAVAVGVCAALAGGDVVYTHHRSHNHYLARGGDMFRLAAELYGREDGCSGGRGGSVHLTARDKGFIISSAILGETIPVALGSALAFKMDGRPDAAVSFFGDAVCEEGIFYESLNYAAVNRLPALLVCENNLYSTESSTSVRQPTGTKLCNRVKSFHIPAEQIDGNDVFEVYKKACEAVARIRVGGGTQFLECMTYRMLEHVGPQIDHEVGRSYRTKAEFEYWQDRCPLIRARERLSREDGVTDAEFADWEQEARQKVMSAVARAKDSPWPDSSDLFVNVD